MTHYQRNEKPNLNHRMSTFVFLCCIFVHFGFAVAGGFQVSTDDTVSHSVTEKGVEQRMKPLPTLFVNVRLWLGAARNFSKATGLQ
jgi:hypothetical protein